MPTYQYACTECGERVEAVQKFTDAPLTVCDTCGGKLRKVFSPVGIVFKGSGFYRTDSRNGSVPGSATAKDKASSDSAAGNGSGDSSKERSSADKAADKPAAKKSGETVSTSSSSSSSSEKVA